MRGIELKLAGFAIVLVLLAGVVRSFYGQSRTGEKAGETPEADEVVYQAISGCQGEGENSNNCFRQEVSRMVKSLGVRQTIASLERLESKEEIFSVCHQLAHLIGQESYKNIGNVAEAYAVGNHACHGGFYHGILEEYISQSGIDLNRVRENEVADKLRTACGNQSDYEAPLIYGECVHGLGHGLMFLTNMDLPASLRTCDGFASTTEAEICYGGVFMENSTSTTNTGHPSRYLKKDDPMYPCNTLPEKYKKMCYQYQSTYFHHLTNDWQKTIELCQKVPVKYQDRCFLVIGSNQPSIKRDVGEMWQICQLISDDKNRNQCAVGVVTALGGRYYKQAEISIDFCRVVESFLRGNCLNQLGRMVREWGSTKAEKQVICAGLELEIKSGDVDWCD